MVDPEYLDWMVQEEGAKPATDPGDQDLTDKVFENLQVKAKVDGYLERRAAGGEHSQPVGTAELWRRVEAKVRQGDE